VESENRGKRPRRLLVCGVFLLALFIILDISVEAGLSQTFDVEVFTAMNSLHPSTWMDSVMIILSMYGREVVWGALIVTLFFLGGEREKKAAITMGLLFLILTGAGYLIKSFDSRLRPYDAIEGVHLLVPKEVDYSFPSGHTFIVVGGAVVAWFTLKRWLAVLLTVEASLVAFSRVYVGVHYPTDLVGGTLLGAGFALIICSNPRLIDNIYNRIPSSIRKYGSRFTAC
jgi:undecaprenyl-diphosphatase